MGSQTASGTCRKTLNERSMFSSNHVDPASLHQKDAARPSQTLGATVVGFDGVSLAYDDKLVLEGVTFTLQPGHMKIILGASGSGKSTILKLLLGLLRPDAGTIRAFGGRLDRLTEDELAPIRARMGMVFQEGALFDSLTVRENVGYRLYEEEHGSVEAADQRVSDVLASVGIGVEPADEAELSGGQRKRVAIARAMASQPQLVLYDEPTTGLDPITATTIDDEIIKLRDIAGVSSMIVTHQLRDAFYVATHQAVRVHDQVEIVSAPPDQMHGVEFLMLRDTRVVFEGDAAALRASTDPYIRMFLS